MGLSYLLFVHIRWGSILACDLCRRERAVHSPREGGSMQAAFCPPIRGTVGMGVVPATERVGMYVGYRYVCRYVCRYACRYICV